MKITIHLFYMKITTHLLYMKITTHLLYMKITTHLFYMKITTHLFYMKPVVQACGSPNACTTGRYAAITLTTSIPTSTEKPYSVVLAKRRTAP